MHNALYWEAKIQLRPAKREVVDYIRKQIDKRGNITISRVEELKTGLDFYISSQRFARALGKKLKKAFSGELKMTRKLFTEKKGKKLYRVTVLFRSKV